jgi:hypothetical protein
VDCFLVSNGLVGLVGFIAGMADHESEDNKLPRYVAQLRLSLKGLERFGSVGGAIEDDPLPPATEEDVREAIATFARDLAKYANQLRDRLERAAAYRHFRDV